MPDVFISHEKEESGEEHEVSPKDFEISNDVPNTESEKASLVGHSHNPLSAFCFYPDHIDFESRGKEEKIILLLRQHIIVNVKWVIITLLMLFVPHFINAFNILSSLPTGFQLIITLSWYLVTLAYALENFLSWYFNVYFVTNKRVIDVDFYNLIYKEVSDASLIKVQDVTYKMGGVVRTIFNYGDIFIQTAAEVSEFEFLAVPNPDKAVKIIEDLISKVE